MDIQTIWHFVAWLAGCSIPAVVLIYVLKRLVKAATDRITTVVDAYAGERAKLLAQFHNLDKLVQQTEKLTATTETIKARISDELWDRQVRWNYKRDLYIRIIERMSELIFAEGEFQAHEADQKSTGVPLNALKEKLTDLIRLTEIAPLALSERAVKTLWNLSSHTAEELYTPKHCASLKAHLDIFREEASKDLGFAKLTNVDAVDEAKT